jgi:CRP-like cAMP-binding protein
MNNAMHNLISGKTRPPIPAAIVLKRDLSIVGSKLNPCPIGVIQNDLLAALPADELAFLLPHMELVRLTFDNTLYENGSKLSHVYFPVTAIIALFYALADGATTEIGVIGHEGLLGASILMSENTFGTAKVQSVGFAYKLKASILKEACNRGGKLQDLLMRYMQALFAKMAQNSICGRHYSVDRQLSCWVLDRLDRLPTNELKATQEMIANMLGVRRESVTEAAGKLQQAGFIRCSRGTITVVNRDGLERYAGECYKISKHEFDSVLSHAAN